jgi:hypothetical protein
VYDVPAGAKLKARKSVIMRPAEPAPEAATPQPEGGQA